MTTDFSFIASMLSVCESAYTVLPVMPAGYNLIGGIMGWGFVALNPDTSTALVAYRGTNPRSLIEWREDATAILIPIPWDPREGMVHAGFIRVYNQSRDRQIALLRSISYKNLIVTGHSLGGPLATFCAFESRQINPTVVTFESPRPGSHGFGANFDRWVPNCTRVKNHGDIVTDLPDALLFSHVGNIVEVRGGQSPLDFNTAHSLELGVKPGLLALAKV